MNYDKIYPTLDLHGEYGFSASVLTKEFIDDNISLHSETICIIHGIGKGIVKKAVHEVLKKDKRIEKYYVDFINPGCTIIKIKKEYLWVNY